MARPDKGRKRAWRFRLNEGTILEVSAPEGPTEKQVRRRGRVSLVIGTVAAAIVFAAVAWAGTDLDSGDRAIVGDAGVSPTGASLIRTGDTTFDLTVTADDGNLPSAQAANGSVSVYPTFTVGASGLTGSGSRTTQNFSVQNFSSSPQTLTFSGLILAAGTDVPLGRSDYPITFGQATTFMVYLGTQINFAAGWTEPRVYVTVNPRPTTSLAPLAASSSQINLSWTASPDASDITDYKIERTGGTQGPTTLTAAKAATSLSDTGLDPNTEYCYKMRARYNDGTNDFFSTFDPSSGTVCATTHPAGPSYQFTGFYAPVDPENIVKAGQGVPLKWNLYNGSVALANEVIDPVIGSGHYSMSSTKISCALVGTGDSLPTADDAGASGLRYDYFVAPTSTASGQNVFVWKTLKDWANTCRRFDVTYGGVTRSAEFKFTK